MSETFNWLHISDLHFGQNMQADYLPNLRSAFFEDLGRLHAKSGPWHAVFFTGDLVSTRDGGQYTRLQTEFLDPLWEKLKALGSVDARLYAVPGNHDLARPPSGLVADALTGGFQSISTGFWLGLEDGKPDPCAEHRTLIQTAFANYEQWRALTPHQPRLDRASGFLPGDFAHTQEVGGLRIGIVGLNSTFLQLAGGDFKGRLAIHPTQLRRLVGDYDAWVKLHDACILLTHQGPAWFSPEAQGDYEEINPAGRFALHLFGHEHESVFKGESWVGADPRWVWQGPSIYGQESIAFPKKEDRRHGYVAGRIEVGAASASFRCWPRKGFKTPWRFAADHAGAKLDENEATMARAILWNRKPPLQPINLTPAPPATPMDDPLLLGLQKILDDDRGMAGLVAAVYGPVIARTNSGSPEVSRLMSGGRVDDLLTRLVDWLDANPGAAFDRRSLKSFVGGVALLAVNPEWTGKMRRAGDGVVVAIPNTDILGARPMNLAYWLLAAATWQPGQRFDFDGLFGHGEACKNEIVLNDEVLARDPTEDAAIMAIKRRVISIVLPHVTEDQLRPFGAVETFFANAMREMAISMRLRQGYRVILPHQKAADLWMPQFVRDGLSRRSIAYLLCRTPLLFDVIPAVIEVSACLHAIRRHVEVR